MSSDLAIRVQGLTKTYCIRHQEQRKESTLAETLLRRVRHPFRSADETETFHALSDVSFDVRKGDVVGVIGRNGAGKSTLLKVLSRITAPTAGRVELYGRIGSLLEVGTGFHPELSGRENIFLNGNILGMSRSEIRRQFDAIVDFAGVEKFLDTPVKRYSSGMYVRLAFAVAAHLQSEILIVDEVLAVGDAEFQRKCLGKMRDVASGGRTVLFVSHHMQSVQVLCNRALYLQGGRCTYDGAVRGAVDAYAASFSATSAAPLNPERRPGTGEYRLVSVAPTKPLFEPHGNKTIAFEIEHRRGSVGQMYLSAHLYDDAGLFLLHMDSRLMDRWWSDGERIRGTLKIGAPWLKPGRYYLDVFVCGTGMIDAYERACLIDVSPILPYPHTTSDDGMSRGAVLAQYDWLPETDSRAADPIAALTAGGAHAD
jgi:lipopolysaccharide transport system ATP-binding protein